MEQHHKEMIVNNAETLAESIDDVDGFLETLIRKEVFPSEIVYQKIKEIQCPKVKKATILKKVCKRGPKAFAGLYDAFMEWGLHACADRLRTGLADKIEVKLSQTRMETDGTKVYKMESVPRGHVLIVNIKSYQNGLQAEREGSERDEANLWALWRQLGFNVTILRDLTKDDFKKEILKFREKEEHGRADSAVVFVMTHGDMSPGNSRHIDMRMSDNGIVTSAWLLDQFQAEACPALRGKPKLFYFQTCRGHDHNMGIHLDSGALGVPSRADTLVAYATTSGTVSMRDIKSGSEFVKQICAVFQERACDTDLETMLDLVAQRLKKVYHDGLGFQVPHFENFFFDKKLYFNPGIGEGFKSDSGRELSSNE